MGQILSLRRYMGDSITDIDRIDCIIFTGTQYINTGKAFSNRTIEVTFTAYNQNFQKGNVIIGNDIDQKNGGITLFGGNYYYATGSTEKNAGTVVYGQKHTLVYNSSNGALFVDNECLDNSNINPTGTILFGKRIKNSLPSVIKLYDVKIYEKSSGILVSHLIPVRKGTVAYLYDELMDELYNSETGAEIPIGIGGYHSLDYQKVAFLQSTGTQYISIPYAPERGLLSEVDFNFTALVNDSSVFGAWSDYSSTSTIYDFALFNNKWYYGSYNSSEGNVAWYAGSPDTDRHVVSLDGEGSIYQDGHLLATNSNLQNSNYATNIYFFNRNSSWTFASRMRLYGVKIYKNNALIANYIPVRVDQLGYMYDTVNGELYGNSGSGVFIVGQDINN